LSDEIERFDSDDRKRWLAHCQNQRQPSPFKHADKKGLVTIPHPKKDIPMGTVKSILRQAGLL